MLLARAAALAALIGVVGCGADDSVQRKKLIIAVGDGISEADALGACNVWAEFMDCTTVGEPNTWIAAGSAAGYDAYAITDRDQMTIDTDAMAADSVEIGWVIAHEFGHRLGILEHLPGPCLMMGAQVRGEWDKSELAEADREAARAALAVSLRGLPVLSPR